MASIYSAVKCPQCERSAVQDSYYKTDELYIWCRRCGYNYTRKIVRATKEHVEFEEDKREGHGVCFLVKKDQTAQMNLFNSVLNETEIERHLVKLSGEDVDQTKSYLITYKFGAFNIVFGEPPENFHLSFDVYKEKMREKYGDEEFFDVLVPIED